MTDNDLDLFVPLMKEKGVTISKKDFHSAVNTIFHNIESKYYDDIHAAMDLSLQEQFDLISSDIEKELSTKNATLTLLDIGCGTGLSTDKLLKTSLGKCISKVYLLDTSNGMLEKCKQKAQNWAVDCEFIEGDIFSLTGENKFDIILTCSVLHHIPNMHFFLDKVSAIQAKNGFFVHLHDPNGDYISADEYQKRVAELNNYRIAQMKKENLNFFSKLQRKINSFFNTNKKDYIYEINQELLSKGIVKSPLLSNELWSVTDLHVENYRGISLKFLQKELGNYRLIKERSYAFYGELKTNLPEIFREKEESFIQKNQLDGRELLAIWQMV